MKPVLQQYNELFGEKHHKICEGKNCECHKEVKKFILEKIKEAKIEQLQDFRGVLGLYNCQHQTPRGAGRLPNGKEYKSPCNFQTNCHRLIEKEIENLTNNI